MAEHNKLYLFTSVQCENRRKTSMFTSWNPNWRLNQKRKRVETML